MAIIDPTIVKRLFETQLQTVDAAIVAASNIFFAGQGVPDGLDRWIKVTMFKLMPQRMMRRSDEPAVSDLVIMIMCHCSRSQMQLNSSSLASVMAAVGAAMMAPKSLDDTDTSHRVELLTAEPNDLGEIDAQRGICAGVVTVTGLVCRTSGSTMLARVT